MYVAELRTVLKGETPGTAVARAPTHRAAGISRIRFPALQLTGHACALSGDEFGVAVLVLVDRLCPLQEQQSGSEG
jgi:hypothetical protein